MTGGDIFRLDGKVALVTGSGRGIGAGIATELASRGAKVVINYAHSAGPAEKLVEKIKTEGGDAFAIKADIGDVEQTVRLFNEAVAHFGRLDIACSNSGVCSFGHVKDVTPEEFDRVFRVNTRGQFFVAREAYKHLSPGGRIIMTSSNTSGAKIVPRHSIYSGSKGAIETFVKCLALDCADKKITVNAIAPGAIVTDMFHEVGREYIPGGDKLTNEEVEKCAATLSPLERAGYPTDIARVAVYLASPAAEWINGKTIGVDGGA